MFKPEPLSYPLRTLLGLWRPPDSSVGLRGKERHPCNFEGLLLLSPYEVCSGTPSGFHLSPLWVVITLISHGGDRNPGYSNVCSS